MLVPFFDCKTNMRFIATHRRTTRKKECFGIRSQRTFQDMVWNILLRTFTTDIGKHTGEQGSGTGYVASGTKRIGNGKYDRNLFVRERIPVQHQRKDERLERLPKYTCFFQNNW